MSYLNILQTVFSALNALIPSIAGNKLANYSSIAQVAVKSAVTTVDGGIDQLQSAFNSFESANPVVELSVAEFTTLAKSLGVSLPTQDAIVSHLKAAVADLAGILVPTIAPTQGAATADASADAAQANATAVPAASA